VRVRAACVSGWAREEKFWAPGPCVVRGDLGDVLSCRDVQITVPPKLRRPLPDESTDANSQEQFWVIIWTDPAGQRWEKVATTNYEEGEVTPDLGYLYESTESPPFPANDARLDTSVVSRQLEGIKQTRVWPIGYAGQCK
jgi:hypothetical protein